MQYDSCNEITDISGFLYHCISMSGSLFSFSSTIEFSAQTSPSSSQVLSPVTQSTTRSKTLSNPTRPYPTQYSVQPSTQLALSSVHRPRPVPSPVHRQSSARLVPSSVHHLAQSLFSPPPVLCPVHYLVSTFFKSFSSPLLSQHPLQSTTGPVSSPLHPSNFRSSITPRSAPGRQYDASSVSPGRSRQ